MVKGGVNYPSPFGREALQVDITERALWSRPTLGLNVPRYHRHPLLQENMPIHLMQVNSLSLICGIGSRLSQSWLPHS